MNDTLEQQPSNLKLSSIEERALSLLGNGISAESTAAALGVTPARISQLLSDEAFSEEVTKLRYKKLQKHNRRDAKYDDIEEKLITKLDKSLPFLVKPRDILSALQIINGAKRRGQDSTETAVANTNIVNIAIPTAIAQKFTVNINNHVIKAGEQELITMQSGTLLDKIKAERAEKEVDNEESIQETTSNNHLEGRSENDSDERSTRSKTIEELGI